MSSSGATSCFLCGSASTSTCSHCNKASFCASSAHRRLHRHNDACLPFRVAVSPVKGRCLVAVRDVEPGELVLADVGAAAGPKCVHVGTDAVQRLCVHCLVLEQRQCPDCPFPVCDRCKESHAEECAAAFSRLPKDGDPAVLMSSVTPYRLWRAQRRDPDLKQRLSFLMTHEEELGEDADMERMCGEVVETLSAALTADEEQRGEVWRCVRLLLVNALDCGDGRGRALFPTFAFLNHSCVTNARHVVSNDGASVRVYSQVAIPEGCEIVITYTNLLRPTESRQSLLLRRWFFLCSCARCADPTELDSYIGGVRCPNCSRDFLLPELTGENDELFAWTCNACAKSISGSAVENVVTALHERLAGAIDAMSVSAFEHFLKATVGYLHENHFLRVIAKRYLSQLYDAEDADQAQKKLQVCADLMRLFDVLDAGLSQSRGMTQIEATKTSLALRRNGGEPGSERDIEADVKLIKDCLEVEAEMSLPGKALRNFLLHYVKQ